MSETNAQEPTMEEILASIRRIISEDEAPAAEAEETAAAEPVAPSAATPEHEDVLELTERVEPPAAAAPPPPRPTVVAPPPPPPEEPLSLDDIDFSAPAPAASPKPPEPPPPAPAAKAESDEALVAPFAASEAALHFGQLAQSLAMPASGRTLEDVVRELLRPLLKEWLEQHLARIVETRVQAEVERISRSRGF